MGKKTVLFISHEATRTGAPLLLLSLLNWLSANSDIQFRILLKRGGELEGDFRSLGKVDFPNIISSSHRAPFRKIGRALYKFEQSVHQKRLIESYLEDNIRLIYSNTVTNGDILQLLSPIDCPVISHVHELEYSLHCAGSENFDLINKFTDHYICVSNSVGENLTKRHSISPEKIDIVHGFTSHAQYEKIDKEAARKDLAHELNIPDESIVIGACGVTTWHKGADLFIQLAQSVLKKVQRIPVHFVWLGKHIEEIDHYRLVSDIEKLGLINNIHFIGHRDNPVSYFSAFDIFTMVSREDSFPLVCLESASVSTPVVCFDNSGGTKEFVEDDCGYVVPYLDTYAMAERIVELIQKPEVKNQMGLRALKKVRERHDISVCCPKILNIIESLLNSPQ